MSIGVVSSTLFSSCEKAVLPSLSFYMDTIHVSSNAQIVNQFIQSNVKWSIFNNEDWVSISLQYGEGSDTISIDILENQNSEERSCKIRVETETLEKAFVLKQDSVKE